MEKNDQPKFKSPGLIQSDTPRQVRKKINAIQKRAPNSRRRFLRDQPRQLDEKSGRKA